MKIAIVGTGIAGNVAAYVLRENHDITVYEAAGYVGGHTDTVDVVEQGRTLAAPWVPLVLAAAARLASVVVGDAGGYCDIAAASAAAVVALHGRTSSARYGPTSRLSASVLARCKLPEEHHASPSRELRCLRCLGVRPVLETTEELAARRWPWDRLARWIGEA